MAKATFDHCCCCIELRVGCLIMGYLEPIGFIFFIIKLVEMWKNVDNLIGMLKALSVNLSDEVFEETGRVIRAVLVATAIVLVLLSAIKIFFTIIMLIGLHKNIRGHVGAYLIYSAIFWIIGVFVAISVIVRFANNELSKLQLPEEVMRILMITSYGYIIGIILTYVISIYFWMVIRSQYHKMPINRPKKPINPVDTWPSPRISDVRPEGSTPQISDEGSRGTKTNYSGQCTSPTDERHLTLPASSDVRPEGSTSQLGDEGIRGTNTNYSGQCTSPTDEGHSTLPASSDVRPGGLTSQLSDEGSRGTKTNYSGLCTSPTDEGHSTLPASSDVWPEGPTSQLGDEGSRGTNTNYSGQCTSPTEEGHSTLPASSDVRPEGSTSQLGDEGSRGTNTN